jgi:uroporphyrinogen-III synthase
MDSSGKSAEGIRNKSVFISKKLSDNSVFRELENYHVSITDEPLIKFTQIPFSYTPQCKWIFFSSKNAIAYFFAQRPELADDTLYGVIGRHSAEHLATFGKNADFIGEGVDIAQIAKHFREVLKDDSVLFPQAMDSMRSIQKYISFSNTLFNLYTYKTTLRDDFEIPYSNILIFTSPSNVNAYLAKYKIDGLQRVIAMGSATRFRLAEYGIKNVSTPDAFGEEGLLRLLLDKKS